MKELKIETEYGAFPIDQKITEKYDLKSGIRSPFTRSRILGKNGEYFQEENKVKESEELKIGPEDEAAETSDGVKFTTAEILDISAGVDSSV